MGASLESSFGAAIGVLEDVPASVNTNLISHPVINHVKIPLIIIIYFWRGLMNKMLSVVPHPSAVEKQAETDMPHEQTFCTEEPLDALSDVTGEIS